MRTIKVGAIQPHVLTPPPSCDCLSETYSHNLDEILQNNILPQLDLNLALLEQAGSRGLDIVTTSEDICALSSYLIDTSSSCLFPALAVSSSEYVETKVGMLAKKFSMYIVACYFKLINRNVYNVATIFDRSGSICGTYKKTHLPPNETWQVHAGNDIPVFDLDFGRVGIEICYDMMFPALSEALSLSGAEIVFHPTGGYGWYDAIGEATLRTRANDNSFYIVTAKNYCGMNAGKSSVIDYWGQILADAGFYENAIVWQEIDLDIPKTQPSWFYQTGMSGEARVRVRHEAERRPELYRSLCVPHTNGQKIATPEMQKLIYEQVKKGLLHW